MAEHKDITVKAQPREGRGKNDARRVRRSGMVPVVVYGGEGESVAAVAPLKELAAASCWRTCGSARRAGLSGAGTARDRNPL